MSDRQDETETMTPVSPLEEYTHAGYRDARPETEEELVDFNTILAERDHISPIHERFHSKGKTKEFTHTTPTTGVYSTQPGRLGSSGSVPKGQGKPNANPRPK